MSYNVSRRLHTLGREAEKVVEEQKRLVRKWETKCREHSLLRQKICEALGLPHHAVDEDILRAAALKKVEPEEPNT